MRENSPTTPPQEGYRVFIPGWSKLDIERASQLYQSLPFPFPLEHYQDRLRQEGIATPWLLQARQIAYHLQDLVQTYRANHQSDQPEPHDVVIVPNPDVTPEEQLLEQSQATWYDLLERIGRARAQDQQLVTILQTHAEQFSDIWLAQAQAMLTFAKEHMTYLLSHFPSHERSDLHEPLGDEEEQEEEQHELHKTARNNMLRLQTSAVVMLRDIPTLKSALQHLVATGRYPDFD